MFHGTARREDSWSGYTVSENETARLRRRYDAYARRYDTEAGVYERLMLGDGRSWACGRAIGDTLEIAVGTGLNLARHPARIRLCGLDLSPGMLALARERALEVRPGTPLVEGDAQRLPFRSAVFDTVVCTLGLSGVPDAGAALSEAHRVLRPGGRLVLLGHVASPWPPVRALQALLESLARSRPTDHQLRRTVPGLRAVGFTVVYRRTSRAGAIERVVAAKDR